MKDGNEMNKLTETSNSLLPELSDEDKDRAENQTNLDWACGLMDFYYNGAVHKSDDVGLTFQVIKDPETDSQGIRILSAYEEELCLRFLAMLKHTFEHAGFTVHIAPYLVLCSYTPAPAPSPTFLERKSNDEREEEVAEETKPRNKATAAQIGMEVV
jgi:hypothetical protein